MPCKRSVGTEGIVLIPADVSGFYRFGNFTVVPVRFLEVLEADCCHIGITEQSVEQSHILCTCNGFVGFERTVLVPSQITFIQPVLQLLLCPVPLNILGYRRG
ncbi:hypothetical protein D3C75_856200 [compost metagenome]